VRIHKGDRNMRRFLLDELNKWKDKTNRKPLILQGARQVGKTWLVKEFGRVSFENTVYINFDRQKELHELFQETLEPDRILQALSAISGERIDPDHTLIIFDEVQEEPRALTSLKYFQEEAPEYAIIATGSFMGIALHQGTSFPVGKVDHMKLHPMTFREFLCAVGKEGIDQVLREKDLQMIRVLRPKMIELLRTYYAVGGMPEAVLTYLETKDFYQVRQKQELLLDYYRMDFSKHARPHLVSRLNQVWDAIPAQLAKKNRKFIYGQIAKGARAKDFELALQWLSDCGLIHIVHRVSKPGMPLKAYEELSAFKVYLNDVGLLGAMGGLPVSSIMSGHRLFEEFKGALSEQYVLTQLVGDVDVPVYYYSSKNSRGEIDFLIQRNECIMPIEVKAEENLQAKSLRAFVRKYPDAKAVRISMSDYREQDWLVNLPLYAFMTLI